MVNYNSNCAKVCGTVQRTFYSHSYRGNDFFKAILDIERDSGKVDSIQIVYPSSIPEPIGLVVVEGSIRTHNIVENGVNRLDIYIYADVIYQATDEQTGINCVEFDGYIVKHNFRITPLHHIPITDLIIANNLGFDKTNYIPCIAWYDNARHTEFVPIGTPVSIIGRLQSRVYEKVLDDGTVTERTAYEVSVFGLKVGGWSG